MTYYILNKETNDYERTDDNQRIRVSENTKLLYERLYADYKVDRVKFERVPKPDDRNLIASYGGGVNDND